MFAVHCPRHGGPVLLDASRITGLTTLADGVIGVELTCYDGERIALLTGRRVTAPPAPCRADPSP